MDMIIADVHIASIRAGDTVMHDGQMRTVCNNNIGGDALSGRTIFGDSYKLGLIPVQRVIFPQFYRGNEVVGGKLC
jgi:hypothetical protein